ncbi:polymorphic toxin-type HINT domain-containing protein [Streptomyces griseorubiginosus]|uniref:polymorphic toxin-type HINT domain-containing protein n=1 Tax=Streptomyces griseorubiginosus TaxID=67304 RepID=UPI0033A686BF
MADGTPRSIQDVQVGDRVLATDPETGGAGPCTDTALITGSGDKQLVSLTVGTDDAAGTETATITAINGHPFWVPDLRQWIEADDLTAGQWLQTSVGTWAQITAVDHHTESATVYNLTVDDLHTYYVTAGGQDLLVHNSTCLLGREGDIDDYLDGSPGIDADVLNLRGTMNGKRGQKGAKGVGSWNWTRNKRFIDDAWPAAGPSLW